MSKMKLIKPSEDVVKSFNELWSDIEAFNNIKELYVGVDLDDELKTAILEELKKEQPMNEKKERISFNSNDDNIRNATGLRDFLNKINNSYHTRVKGGTNSIYDKLIDDGIRDKEHLKEWIEENGLKKFVKLCKDATRTYTYSYATKVCSFLFEKENEYPIVDKYAVTIIDAYDYKEKIPKSMWGDYDNYKNNYDIFMKKFKLESFSYKEIDRFLWTYGKLLDIYWEKMGVIKFNSVSFNKDS